MFLKRALLLLLAGIVGCDAGVNTRMVIRNSTGHDEVNPVSGEDLHWIAHAASQFELSEIESEHPGIRIYSSIGTHPILTMFVFLQEHPIRIEIVEDYPTSRTSRHRKLVETITTESTRNGFEASIEYQTRDPFPLHWVVLPALGIATAWILTRNFRWKPLVKPNRASSEDTNAKANTQ
ncbi:MAG: hypothetical protein SFV81_29535 [Pirellulaceae bacterium]|nr:hypothetical protein [Pirellulaceae bacterium]